MSNFMKLHPVEAERAPCGRTYEWTGKQDKGKSRSHKINFFVLRGSNNKQRLLIVYFFLITEKECLLRGTNLTSTRN